MRKNKILYILMVLTLGAATACGSSNSSESRTESRTEAKSEGATTGSENLTTEAQEDKETPAAETPEAATQTNIQPGRAVTGVVETSSAPKTITYTAQSGDYDIQIPNDDWTIDSDDGDHASASSKNAMIDISFVEEEDEEQLGMFQTQEELEKSLKTQCDQDGSTYEVKYFSNDIFGDVEIYKYLSKVTAADSSVVFSDVYVIESGDGAYVIFGSVNGEDEVLLQNVENAIDSFSILRGNLKGATTERVDAVNASDSKLQKEVQAQLNTLKYYDKSVKYYAVNAVNVRQQPSSYSDSVAVLDKAEKVKVIGETTNWYKVKYDGMAAYVSKKYCTKNKDEADGKLDKEESSYKKYDNKKDMHATGDVHLRKKCSAYSDILGVIEKNAEVKVIGATKSWYKVKYNEQTGYVDKDFLTIETPQATQPASDSNDDAAMGIDTGNTQPDVSEEDLIYNFPMYALKDANLRTDPTVDSDVITMIYEGDGVKASAKTDNGWYKVKDNDGNIGYIYEAYLGGD